MDGVLCVAGAVLVFWMFSDLFYSIFVQGLDDHTFLSCTCLRFLLAAGGPVLPHPLAHRLLLCGAHRPAASFLSSLLDRSLGCRRASTTPTVDTREHAADLGNFSQ
jgi:hypothetical protein